MMLDAVELGVLVGLLGVVLSLALFWKDRRKAQWRKAAVFQVGRVHPEFEKVLEAFKQNFYEGREAGAQLCCFYKGECVIDVTGGSDEEKHLDHGKLAVAFSTTKCIESLVIAQLVDRGLLDYDEPIATYWPEFGNVVNVETTVGDLMRHQAGVSGLKNPLPREEGLEILRDPERTGKMLEKNEPEWHHPKEVRQVYHAITRGMYSCELLRRVDGRHIHDFVQEEIVDVCNSDPKNPFKVELTIGKPTKDTLERVSTHYHTQSKGFVLMRIIAHMILPKFLLEVFYDEMDLLQPFEFQIYFTALPKKITRRAFRLFDNSPLSSVDVANDKDFQQLPLASASGLTNARSLASIANTLVSGEGKLLSKRGFENALGFNGRALKDEILCRVLKMSNAGWGLDRFEIFGCPGWRAWAGAGGSVYVFDEKNQAAFCYLVNGFDSQQHKARGLRCLKAFKSCIDSKLGN